MEQLPPAARTYVWVTSAAMTVYVLLLLEWAASIWLAVKTPAVVVLILTIATCVAIAVQLWSLLRVVQQSDEFMRTVMAKRLLTAAVIVIGAVTMWGLLQRVGLAIPFPLPLTYIGFFIVHASLIPLINANRP